MPGPARCWPESFPDKLRNTVHIISLGCPKNLVDSEVMAAILAEAGFDIVPLPHDAEILIVNTCAFILPAKEESIDEIFRMAELKRESECRYLVVTGCLSQRYGAMLSTEIPEVDLFLGTSQIPRIAELIETMRREQPKRRSLIEKPDFLMNSSHPRLLSTPPHTAYLKIAEGCSNHCSYCVIPLVRGKFRSRPLNDLLQEVETLARRGVKEIIVAAQETTLYGSDLGYVYGLSSLLREIALVDGIRWIRVLYTYPADLDDELFQTIRDVEKVCNYIDIPVQHIDDDILASMNRRGDSRLVRDVIARARKIIPGVALRTSLIVGFPGETQERFENLFSFVQQTRFDHLGVFEYSREEGTKAETLSGQISEREKELRRGIIMEEQALISHEINEMLVGSTMEILIEGESDLPGYDYVGRANRQAPDIDGITYVQAGESAIGDIVHCRIVSADDYDLFAEEVMNP